MLGFSTESLKEMTFQDRNSFLAEAWSTSLTKEERDHFNSHAKMEKVLSTKEQIKRTLKSIKYELKRGNSTYLSGKRIGMKPTRGAAS